MSEHINRGADMSEFEVEFDPGDHLATMWQEEQDQKAVAEQLLQQDLETTRQRGVFKRSMLEKERPHKSPRAKLHHLNEAYNAALYLKTVDELPSPDVFDRLQAEIQQVQDIIQQANTVRGVD